MKFTRRIVGLGLSILLASCAAPSLGLRQSAAPAPAPKSEGMVAAANPHAVEAGLRVLREGGSAVDAAVAVQAVLGLVEPQSSGLGGGGFLLFYDAKTKDVTFYNGRETAPAGAIPEMFMGPEGKPLTQREAVISGRATGVPGVVAMLGVAHARHGKLPWNRLFTDAERLAEDGFVVSPRMQRMIQSPFPQNSQPDNVRYFTKPDGTRYRAGDTLKNPAYAETLRTVAAQGGRALLQGKIGEAIVARVQQAPLPSTMTMQDLARYQPKVSSALCRSYKVYVICTAPPPASGVGVLQGMAILAHTDIANQRDNAEGWYLFSQGSRLMYADRDRYVGDPDFVDVPVQGMLDPAYVAERAKLIGATAGPPPKAGAPRGAGARAPDRTQEPAGTSHFVIVDAAGNAVSMTTTVESIFGTGRMVHGMFLNNQMTDFSFSPKEADGAHAANAVAPGKRPRSSMSPIIVLDQQGRLVATLGSPGGNAILAYNLKTLVALLDWKMPIKQAIELPNLIARGAVYGAEMNDVRPEIAQALLARGVKLESSAGAEDSGLHGIVVTPNGLDGAADPRREGVARKP